VSSSCAERAALIHGLRSLADYLEANPEVPAPDSANMYAFPPHDDCVVMRAEIDAVAELLGSQPRETASGQHYGVTRSFGPVEYRAASGALVLVVISIRRTRRASLFQVGRDQQGATSRSLLLSTRTDCKGSGT
jgi:hypothetical protein